MFILDKGKSQLIVSIVWVRSVPVTISLQKSLTPHYRVNSFNPYIQIYMCDTINLAYLHRSKLPFWLFEGAGRKTSRQAHRSEDLMSLPHGARGTSNFTSTLELHLLVSLKTFLRDYVVNFETLVILGRAAWMRLELTRTRYSFNFDDR